MEKGNRHFNEYVNAIINEIKWHSKRTDYYKVKTIYFGGGTPNLLHSTHLIKILNIIREYFNVDSNSEITIELNPEFCKEKTFFDDLKLAGFNRLSIGAQSAIDSELEVLGRIHNHKTTVTTIKKAINSGFDNISLDMIFNIPQQKKENIIKTIEEFLSFNPKHISAYSLTKEQGTKYYKMVQNGSLIENSEEVDSEHFKLCHDLLTKNGFSHYEISNYSLKGYESKHNSNYWNGTDYIGFGPSAHSKIGEKRFWHNASLSNYLKKNENNNFECDHYEILNDKMKITELLLTKFRLKNGIEKNKIKSKDWDNINNAIKFVNKKYSKRYFIIDDEKIVPTIDAWLVLDSLLVEIDTM